MGGSDLRLLLVGLYTVHDAVVEGRGAPLWAVRGVAGDVA